MNYNIGIIKHLYSQYNIQTVRNTTYKSMSSYHSLVGMTLVDQRRTFAVEEFLDRNLTSGECNVCTHFIR